MIYQADENDMKAYCAIVQRIAHLDYQREQLLAQLSEWEQAHTVAEPETEEAPEQ
jgi:hypothetical protein